MALVPVCLRHLHAMSVALPVGDEPGHACDLRVGAALPEVEQEGFDWSVVPVAEDANGHQTAHGVEAMRRCHSGMMYQIRPMSSKYSSCSIALNSWKVIDVMVV